MDGQAFSRGIGSAIIGAIAIALLAGVLLCKVGSWLWSHIHISFAWVRP